MDFLGYLFDRLSAFVGSGSSLVYVGVFFAAFLECIPLAGIIVPGALILMIGGFFARLDATDFALLLLVGSAGAILGDIGAFYLGRRFGLQWLSQHERFARAVYFDKARQYFTSHGDKSVLLARFVGPLRPVIPFVAGVFQMAPVPFLFFNIIGGILWASAFLAVGYFFGASWELVERFASAFGLVVCGLIIAILLIIFIWRSVAQQRRAVLRLIREVTKAVGRAVAQNQDVAALHSRHVRFFRWLGRRLDRKKATGMTMTLGVLAVACGLWYTITLPLQIVTNGPIIQTDLHIARLMQQLTDPILTTAMIWMTQWGEVEFVISLLVTLTTVLVLFRQRTLAALGIVGLGSTAVLVYFGKQLIARPRPEIAPLIPEQLFSLPSGHAVHSMMMYGWIAYCAWCMIRVRRIRWAVLGVSGVLITVIGLSRVYLGVHWASDVWTGYALGGTMLALCITAAELHKRLGKAGMYHRFGKWTWRRRAVLASVLTAELVLATVLLVHQPVIMAHALPTRPTEYLSEQQLHEYIQGDMLVRTQTLGGRPQEPISFILVGSREQIQAAFDRAQWSVADPLNLDTIRRVAIAALENDSYPTAPITPVFYDGHPHDLGVQKETDRASVRQRHHARFWKTSVHLTDGREVWVGTASYDVGLKRFITHRIDPAIDIERDFLHDELMRNNPGIASERIAVTTSTWGRNFTGDLYFTDGNAYLLFWPRP